MSTVRKAVTFGRRQSLDTAADFDRLFREGRRSADRLFTILYCENNLGEPRLGFAISRHKVRNAVGRNRLRRLVRESLRTVRSDLRAVDIVVLANEPAALATNPDIFASLGRHWARLNLPPKSPKANPGITES